MQRQRTVPDAVGDGRGGERYGVVLLHPLPVVREALGLFIETQSDFEVVVSESTWDEAVRGIERLRRKSNVVAIVAIDLAGEHDAFWSIASLRGQYPSVRIAAIGASAERLAISRALFVGADGFIDKRAHPIEFLDGLRRCAQGETVLVGVPKDWLGPIAGAIEQQATDSSPLTEREREVLAVAAEGLKARDIGKRLGVAERTVTTHLARIYEKLGVNSRMAAITTASRSGILRVVPPFEDERIGVG
jgi:DNA-binding NarL/FixJ family response regulator